MKTIIFTNQVNKGQSVYGPKQLEQLAALYGCESTIYTKEDLPRLADTEYIFSTWGMPSLTVEEIRQYLPNLKCIFYGAGSVKAFAKPFLDCGVRIFSAWQANAIPVAECCIAQILLANKGFYYLSRAAKAGWRDAKALVPNFPGNYEAKVGLIGLGAIGMLVLEEMKKHDVELYVYSSKVTKENEAQWGVKAATLEDIFRECNVISNHLANVPATVGILNEDLLKMMQPWSTFINTGRGAQVDEAALIAKLKSDETITAVLDVTYPEPPLAESEFYTLDNVILTPHSAGSNGLEVRRMAQYMIDESKRYFAGEKCLYEVTEDMLDRMA